MAQRSPRPPAVTVTIDRAVARLTLARGETGNQLDEALHHGLVSAAASVAAADDVRVVVLEAEGRAFSCGLPSGIRSAPAPWPDGVAAIAAMEVPVVVALSGDAIGLGLALVLAGDLIVADPRATMSAGDPSSGGCVGGGLTQRLTRAVGPTRATEMLLLGTRVAARTALAWGLAHRVAGRGRARTMARALARELCRQGPIAMRYAKEACRRALDLPLDQGMRLEHDLYVLLQTTADRRAGVEAFLERRTPRFQGR